MSASDYETNPQYAGFRKKNSSGHGHAARATRSPEYQCWAGMIRRCENERDEQYKYYGGRCIKVCDEWRYDFPRFLSHVGQKPSASHSIDRIDNDKNYEPGNVRWATPTDQSRNRRGRLLVEFKGQMMPLSQACEALGVKYNLVQERMKRGWTFKSAVETPSAGQFGRRLENRGPK